MKDCWSKKKEIISRLIVQIVNEQIILVFIFITIIKNKFIVLVRDSTENNLLISLRKNWLLQILMGVGKVFTPIKKF